MKNTKNSKAPFRAAKIYTANNDLSKRWFVYFYVWDLKQDKLIRKREYVPQSYNETERLYALQKIAHGINQLLKSGRIGTTLPEDEPEQYLSITEAVISAVKEKEAYCAKRTNLSISAAMNAFLTWLKESQLDKIDVKNFNKSKAHLAINELATKKKWAPKTRNNILGYCKMIFELLLEQEKIEINPFSKIKNLKENEPNISLWNPHQIKTIANHCKANDTQLFLIILLVYRCFIRPQEIVRLTLEDFDCYKCLINIPGEKSKNRKTQSVTMPNQLSLLVEPIKASYPSNYRLISSGLNPGQSEISITRINERFNKAKAICKLPKELKLYSLKHTGNSELLERGVSLEQLKDQNRHHSVAQTEIYAKRIGNTANPVFKDVPEL